MATDEPRIVRIIREPFRAEKTLNNPVASDMMFIHAVMSTGPVKVLPYAADAQTLRDEDWEGLTIEEALERAAERKYPSPLLGTVGVTVSKQVEDFAATLLEAATLFAHLSEEVECDPTLKKNPPYLYRSYPEGDPRRLHASYAIGAIMTAAAAIDAAVNQPFVTAFQTYRDVPLAEATAEYRAQLAAIWAREKRRGTFHLAGLALQCAGKSPDDIVSWVPARLLYTFRNEIMHYDEGAVVVFPPPDVQEPSQQQQVEGKLNEMELRANPYATDSLFPFPYFGHKTIAWAVDTAGAFIREYRGALPVQSR